MLENLRHGEVIKGIQRCDRTDCLKDFKWVYQHKAKGKSEAIDLYAMKRMSDEEMLEVLNEDTMEATCECNHCKAPVFFKVQL